MSNMLSTRRLALAGSIGPVLFVAIAIVMTILEWHFLTNLAGTWSKTARCRTPAPPRWAHMVGFRP